MSLDVPPRVAMFRLQASDGPVHFISRFAIYNSQFLVDSFNGVSPESQTTVLKLENVASTELIKAIDFLEYHSQDAESLSSYRFRISSGLADEFDLSLLNSNGLFVRKNAAEALQMPMLEHLCQWKMTTIQQTRRSVPYRRTMADLAYLFEDEEEADKENRNGQMG